MSRPLDLDGAVAVLTGAGSGIGRATALLSRSAGRLLSRATCLNNVPQKSSGRSARWGVRSSGCLSMSPLKRTWRSSVTLRSSGSVESTW